MSGHTATPQFEVPGIRSLRDGARRLTGYWWVLLVAGIAWVAVSLVVLQFDHASVTTVGILVGLMFLGAGIENIALATLGRADALGVGALRRRVPRLRHRLLRQPRGHLRRAGRHARLPVPARRRVVDGAGVPRASDQPALVDAG